MSRRQDSPDPHPQDYAFTTNRISYQGITEEADQWAWACSCGATGVRTGRSTWCPLSGEAVAEGLRAVLDEHDHRMPVDVAEALWLLLEPPRHEHIYVHGTRECIECGEPAPEHEVTGQWRLEEDAP